MISQIEFISLFYTSNPPLETSNNIIEIGAYFKDHFLTYENLENGKTKLIFPSS